MIKLLRIQSHDTEEITELLNLLDSIVKFDPAIKKYNYSISFFDGSPKEDFEGSFVEFLDSINKNEKGLILNFNQLQERFSELFQIYDLVLLIDNEINKFEKSEIKEDSIMYNNLFLTITYFDGGFWEVSSIDKNLLNFIKTQQPNSKLIQL